MAMMNIRRGNLFDDPLADTFVVTCNCEGVMGTGIALECRERFPDVYKRYREQCKKGLWKPGMISLMVSEDDTRLLLVTTKDQWRYNSKRVWVEEILRKIAQSYERYDIRVLAMSHLGCGNGKLDKEEFRRWADDILSEALIDLELYL